MSLRTSSGDWLGASFYERVDYGLKGGLRELLPLQNASIESAKFITCFEM